MDKWTFWIDCGGTFTDILAHNDSGDYKVHKILSHSPHYASAVTQGISEILGHRNFKQAVKEVRLGTTVATNAFLEKNGVPCALVTTLGHRDLLEIRHQNRPKLFDLKIEKIPPLYRYVTQVQGRLNADGSELIPCDLEIAQFELQRILDQGIKSVAIAFMHSTINPAHEIKVGELARKMGFEYVSLSHQVSPVAKFIPRAETAVVDAYLSPYLDQYTSQLEKDLGISEIYYMQSDGGLCRADELKGYNALLSGPAGGLIGAIQTAKQFGHDKIITFDMGGTSTDVGIYDGQLQIDPEPNFYGIHLLAPMVDIHTVAAGGGSVLNYDQGRFTVGPESARAYPGPASYRNGGPLTVTDANLFLKRIDKNKFPKVFGPDQNQTMDDEIVADKFNELAQEIGISAHEVASGFLDVAVETMASAIRKISIERGYDPKEFTLVSFGGAGGQLALKVAQNLEMKNVFIHPLSSVLSAFGMGLADQSLTLRAKASYGHDKLEKDLIHKLNSNQLEFTHIYSLKSKGSDHEIDLLANTLKEAHQKFIKYYTKTFGVEYSGEILCETIAVIGKVKDNNKDVKFLKHNSQILLGPQVINENNTAIVIEQGWQAQKNEQGIWSLTQKVSIQSNKAYPQQIELEIFYQKFQFIAEQMGVTLKKLAHSVNIKERNDFSCALFSAKGELLSNAPHIPVHLGSMGDAVRAVNKEFKVKEGDSFICNDPNFGGTHLPDITIITPVFFENKLTMWVASRGHHADIGGISPGSMPGNSTCLSQEGIIIKPTCFVEKGILNQELLVEILTNNDYPVRNLELNLNDIKAKLAANNNGVSDLISLFKKFSVEKITSMVEAILDYSHIKTVSILEKFDQQSATKQIADDRVIKVQTQKANNKFVIDFTGTSDCLASNFNTPLPVVKASVLFVLRSMIKENIPLNDGIMRAIDLKVPKGSMLNPNEDSAVVAGNVETSQIICDALFSAFNIQANSQGTMNNLSFGNDTYQYYETIAGGQGASIEGEGASGVQVNMTNSLLTDPEVFETRYPVRIDLMGLRHGSGGSGEYKGGDGVYRKLTFLENMQVSFLTQSRKFPPLGIAGGENALRGRNLIETAHGLSELDECVEVEIKKGETVYIESPGGGGFGQSKKQHQNLVFGFGSNMDLTQIKKRCPSAKLVTRAYVQDVEIRYTRYSEVRKGGVADMYHAPGHKVWGLIVDISQEDLVLLDEIECGGMGYKRIEVSAFDDNGKEFKAYAYDVIDKKPDITPTKVYEWLVYSGAYNLNLPNFYLKHLKKFSR